MTSTASYSDVARLHTDTADTAAHLYLVTLEPRLSWLARHTDFTLTTRLGGVTRGMRHLSTKTAAGDKQMFRNVLFKVYVAV